MKRKYPLSIFLLGVVLNFLVRYFYLFLPGLILCVIGIWSEKCLAIGLGFWLVDLVLSVVAQIRIRKEILAESDNAEFNEIMDACYGQEDSGQSENQEILEKLVVYRTLKENVRQNMTLEELIDTFRQMCDIPVGQPDMLLFQTGNFSFTGEKRFHFDLVRQFQFLDQDEYVQLHLTVLYEPSAKTALLRSVRWGEPEDGQFFQTVRNSPAYRIVKDLPIARVDIDVHET